MVLLGIVFLTSLVLFSPLAWAADIGAGEDHGTSMQMLERAEIIVYGEPGRGGLIERLNSLERELFGRDLPGSISERHAAILNFLEVGTPEQPSMLFKIGIAEWLIGEPTQPRRGSLPRVERLETHLDGTMQYGRPLAMRVERLLAALVADRVTAQEVILPTATVLQVQFLEEVRNATARAGDRVALALINDLFVGNVLIAPRGSLIDAVVRSVRQPRLFGVPGRITIDSRALIPLGPQRPEVTQGEASRRATEGVEGMIGAGGAAIGGALLLGPLGLVAGGVVRGNAVNIPQGSIMFLETSGDVRILGYPIPDSLRIDPSATVRETIGTQPQPRVGEREVIQLPAEQRIN